MSTGDEKRRVGPFELEDKLGVGGMGIVYRATYVKTGQKVAVKVLAPDLTADPKVAKRFEREMDILKRLKHPHIIQYYGGSSSGVQRFYAMELVTGGSLDQLLRKKGRFSWEEAVEYGIQIAKALEHAHNAGVIHRDLKPANLLLTGKGVLKLSDFGIARDEQATQLTAAGKTLGTMAYMAPEQITGKTPISRKTDLYALGCVLFQMLTGRPPFQSETNPELLFKHLDEEPASVREFNMDVPKWLDELVAELLEKDPQDRPHDALAVQVKLDEVKQKVAEQQSLLTGTLPDGAAAITVRDGKMTATRSIGQARKKKKKLDQTPVYEKTWFLGACLAGVVGLLAWGFWPESEQKRFDRVHALVAADANSIDLGLAIDKYLADFPEGENRAKVQAFQDDLAMKRAEREAERNAESGNPESEPERLYIEARQYEKFGDRLTAIEKYEAMQTLLKDDEKSRPYLNLARRQIDKITKDVGSNTDRTAFVRQQIAAADELYLSGEKLQAREKWQSIVKLYGDNPEFDVHVKKARERIIDAAASMQTDPPESVSRETTAQ